MSLLPLVCALACPSPPWTMTRPSMAIARGGPSVTRPEAARLPVESRSGDHAPKHPPGYDRRAAAPPYRILAGRDPLHPHRGALCGDSTHKIPMRAIDQPPAPRHFLLGRRRWRHADAQAAPGSRGPHHRLNLAAHIRRAAQLGRHRIGGHRPCGKATTAKANNMVNRKRIFPPQRIKIHPRRIRAGRCRGRRPNPTRIRANLWPATTSRAGDRNRPPHPCHFACRRFR